jgi:translation initiation factor 1A
MAGKIGGKKTKRVKKHNSPTINIKNTPLSDSSLNETYGIATKMLGDRRLLLKCIDISTNVIKEIMAHIGGRFRGQKNWIEVGSILLISLRDFQNSKADILYIYNHKEIKYLKKLNLINNLLDVKDDNDNIIFINNKNISDSEEETQIVL